MAILSDLKEAAKRAAAKLFSSSSDQKPSTPASEFDAGFLGRSNTALPPVKQNSMTFSVGEGLNNEQKQRAQGTIQKQIQSQREQELFAKKEKQIIPQPVKDVTKAIAPKTYEALHQAQDTSRTTVQRVTAGASAPFRAAQELFVQPFARTAVQSGRMVVTGGDDKGFTPKSAFSKFILGEERVEPIDTELSRLPILASKIAKNLPQVKNLPEGDWRKTAAEYGAGLPLAVLSGSLKASDADVGLGSASKKILTEGAERLVKEGSERAIKQGLERTTKDVAESTALKLYRGNLGSVSEAAPDFKNVLQVKGNQRTFLSELASKGDIEAAKVLQEGKSVLPNSFDEFLDARFKKEGYDAVSYEGKMGKNTWHEVRDVDKNISYTDNKKLAEIYAMGRSPKQTVENFEKSQADQGLLESLRGSSEFEHGYANFKKLAQRNPDYAGDAIDYEGFRNRLLKSGKYKTGQEVENKFLSSAAGNDLSNDEILNKYRERFLLEQKAQTSRITKTKSGYVFNGSQEPLSRNTGILAEANKKNQVYKEQKVQPGQAQDNSLSQTTEKARQAASTKAGLDQSVPLEDIVKRLVPEVKSKVNILDYLRTPQDVLNKVGLYKEAILLKRKYDDYLRELPIEINKITAWSKRAPAAGAETRIFKYLDGQETQLFGEEKVVADEIKTYLEDWANKFGLPQSGRIAHYITHLFDSDFVAKEFDQDIAKLITDKVAGSVYDPFLQKRLGAMGYKEDVWQALDAYVKRAVRKVNMDEALGPLQKAADRLDVDSYKYVESLASRVNLRPTAIDNLIDNLIKSSPVGYRLGQRPLSVISRKGRQAIYRGTLGLNPASAIRNLTQGVNTYAELGGRYTIKGYIDLAKSLKNGSKELEEVGVLRDDFIQDRTYSAVKKFWEKFDKGLFLFFEGAEKINRGSAYFGAKAKALAAGKSEQEAVAFAKNIVEKTQFRFGSVDTPVALQSDIAKIFTQFQSFNVKQTEFLAEKVKAKDLAGLVRYTLGSAVIIGAAGKLIGLEPKDMIPFSGVATGRTKLGETPMIKTVGTIMGALFNAPDTYGRERSALQKTKDISKTLVPFFPAGVQVKKTVEGIQALKEGGVKVTSEGRKGYEKIDTPVEKAKSVLLGPRSIIENEQTRLKEYDKIADSLKSSHEKVKNDLIEAMLSGTDQDLDLAMEQMMKLNDAVIDSIDEGVNDRIIKFSSDKEYKAMIDRYQISQKDIQNALKKSATP